MTFYARYPSNNSISNVTASSPLASSGGATPNISLTGVVPVANGGTNAATASAARTNLGLDPNLNVAIGTYGARPAAGVAGRIYFETNGVTYDRDSGAAWASFGPINPITPPDPTYVWSWVNQNSATIAAFNGGLKLTTIANTPTTTARVKSLPVAPYTITVMLNSTFWVAQGTSTGATAGLLLRESGTGKGISMGSSFAFSHYITSVNRLDTNLDYSATSVNAEIMGISWLQITDDGVNRSFNVSKDGFNFLPIYSEANNAYIVPDQIGFTANSYQTSQPTIVVVYSWVQA